MSTTAHRYHVCHKSEYDDAPGPGEIHTTATTRSEAFEAAIRLKMAARSIVTVFDSMARIGEPELWAAVGIWECRYTVTNDDARIVNTEVEADSEGDAMDECAETDYYLCDWLGAWLNRVEIRERRVRES